MLKLEAVHVLLATHTELPFLTVSENSRLRTSYYSTLCKLVFADDTPLNFYTFIEPFTALFTKLNASLGDPELLRNEQARHTWTNGSVPRGRVVRAPCHVDGGLRVATWTGGEGSTGDGRV